MANNKTITLTLDVQAQIGKLQSQIGDMQKILDGLKMPDLTKQGTDKLIGDLQDRIKKVKEYTENNTLDLVNEKKVQAELSAIQKSFVKVFDKVKASSSKIELGGGAKATKALEAGIKEYEASIKDATAAIEAQEVVLSRLNQQYEKLQKSVDISETIKKNTEAEIEGANKRVEAAKKAREAYAADPKHAGWDPGRLEANFRKTVAGKEEKAALAELTEAAERALTAEHNLENAKKALAEKGPALVLQIDQEKTKLKELQTTLEAINDVQLEALKSKLASLKQDGSIDLDFDPNTIQNAEELNKKLEQMKEKDLGTVSQAIEQLGIYAKESANSTLDLSEGLERDVDSAKKFNTELDQFKRGATYFFGINNAINLFQRAVRSAINTVKDLDNVMTQTAVVTNYSVSDMWEQLPEYTKRANELGVSIHDAYEAATLYYQQGLKTNEVMAVSNETLKMARIAGLDAATATDRMTNALRGFNMAIDESSAQRVNDVYSKLAAITASNTDEISTAMTKVASLAHSANMEFETTAAFLAQMIETTRESAETAGTALKTVVARFSEVKKLYSEGDLLGTDEEGEEIDVNKVSAALRSAGINLNEYFTGAKGLDDIFIDLAAKWQDLDMVQQRYIATMAAGSRQQSRFLALMSDYARTTQLVTAANTSAGASQKQFEKTLESFQSKVAKLQNSWNTLLMGFANNVVIKQVIDFLDKLVTAISKLLEKLDRVPGALGNVTGFAGRLVAAFAGLKAGGVLVDKALSKIGKKFTKGFGAIGEKGGEELSKGLSIGVTSSKTGIFSKGFWNNVGKVDTSALDGFKKSMQENVDLIGKMEAGTMAQEEVTLLWMQAQEKLAAQQNVLNQLDALQLSEQEKSIILTQAQIDKDFALRLQKGNVTREEAKQIILEQTQNSIRGKGLISLLATVVATRKQGDELAKENLQQAINNEMVGAGTIAKIKLTIANWALNTSLKAIIGTCAIFAVAIASVIAVGYALVKLFSAMKEKSPEETLEEAKEASEAAGKAAESAANAYSDLNRSFEDLGNKYETIETLTRGTQEWRDAVSEVNGQVLELMANYDTLRIANENGVLKVVNMEAVTQETARRRDAAQASQIAAQQSVLRAQAMVDRENLSIGGAYRDGLTGMQRETYDQAMAVAAEKIISGAFEGTQEELKAQVQDYLESMSIYIDVTDGVIDELREYGNSVKNQKEQIDQQYNALAAVSLSNADLVKGTEGQSSSYLSSTRMDSFYIDEVNRLAGVNYDIIKEALSKELGYTNYATYSEANGEISGEQAAEQLALIRAQQKATDAVNDFSKNLNKLSPIIQQLYSRSDFAGISQEEIQRVTEETGFDYEAFKEATKEEQFQMLEALADEATREWENLTPELRALFGSLDDFQKEFMLGYIRGKQAFDQAKEKFESFKVEDISGFNTSNGGALNDLANKMADVFTASGTEGVQELTKEIQAITEGMDAEEAEKFINALDSIEWTDLNQVEQIEEVVSELTGYKGDLSGLQNKISELADATRSVDLEKFTDQVRELTSLAAKIKSGEQGITGFDEETVQKLVSSGAAAYSDFTLDPDGTLTYIGNDITDLLTKIYGVLEDFDVKELEEQIAKGEAFNRATEGKQVERSNLSDIVSTLIQYNKEGGEGISWDKIYEIIREENLEEAQRLYDELAGYGAEVAANTAAIDQKEQARLQLEKTPTENAALAMEGNTNAAAALRGQAAGVLPTDLYAQNMNDYASLSNLTEVFEKASQLGFDTNQLNAYIKQLKVAKKSLTDVGAAQVALANTRQTEGMKYLVDNYEDWTALLTEDGKLMTDLDADSALLAADMKKAVNNLLNTTKDLPDAFYESSENMALVKKAVEEGEDAIYDLRIAAAEFQLAPDVDFSQAYPEIEEFYDYLRTACPTLEVGSSMDVGPIQKAFDYLTKVAGKTAEDVQAYFNSLGIEFEIEYDYKPLYEGSQYGYHGITGYEKIPKGIKAKGSGSPKYTGNVPSSKSYSSKGSGGGGGGSGSEKNDSWENPYDELYNLTEKINEALRTREALERRYEKLVKKTASTVGEVTKAYYDQIRQLRTEADLQYQMQAGRARQLNNVGNEYYMDSEGNRSTFNALGVTKYASYDQKTGLLQIDWSGLEALEGRPDKVEEGKAAEAYISRLEELQDQFEEVRDKLWDIEDQIEELREEAIENYLTFEDRVMDALVNNYQKQIDDASALFDMIKDNTDAVIKGIQEDVALSRQIRDNTKKEEDIANKEARLAYLRRDTSGANALEIKKLEEEIGNARESYSDSLVDQQITQLQDDANKAAEQRQHQIEIMQHQLDIAKETGTLWGEVWDLINTATAADGTFSQNTELVTLLEESEAYQSLSKIGQMKWWEEVAEAFKRAQVGLSEAEDKYGVDANGDGKVTSSGTSAAISSTAAMSSTPASAGSATTSTSSSSAISTTGSGHFAKVGTYEHPMAQMPSKEVSELQQALNAAGFTDNNGNKLAVDGKYGSKTRAAVTKLQQKLGNVKVDGYYGPETRSATLKSQFKAYKTGGVADFTGPAWLDGSKTHPELVLNAKDTQNFIALKDILASLLSGQGGGSIGVNGGDNYFNINIDAEIGSDYDVSQLAAQIKKEIYNDSSYRNVNTINLMR